MYREDRYLEIADLRLRLFVEYCKEIPVLREKINTITSQIRNRTVRSRSVIKLQQEYLLDDDILDLITERDALIKKFKEEIIFVRPIALYLQTLNPQEIDLLSLRYEKNKTLRQLGEIYNYSYMNMSRLLDSILEKFTQ